MCGLCLPIIFSTMCKHVMVYYPQLVYNAKSGVLTPGGMLMVRTLQN